MTSRSGRYSSTNCIRRSLIDAIPHIGTRQPGGPLAEFITKMQVGHREPALRLMEKSEAPIEQDAIGNHCLVRA